MYRLTYKKAIDAGACYSDKRLRNLIPPGGVGLNQVATARRIPLMDRYWIILGTMAENYKMLIEHAMFVANLVVAPDDPKFGHYIEKVKRRQYTQGPSYDNPCNTDYDKIVIVRRLCWVYNYGAHESVYMLARKVSNVLKFGYAKPLTMRKILKDLVTRIKNSQKKAK